MNEKKRKRNKSDGNIGSKKKVSSKSAAEKSLYGNKKSQTKLRKTERLSTYQTRSLERASCIEKAISAKVGKTKRKRGSAKKGGLRNL